MATIKGQAKSEPATPIIREDQLTPTQPTFQSLSYTKVRDFAYPPSHPLHYGPPPIPSISSTPGSARDSGLFSGANGISAFLGWWNPAPGAGSPGGRRMSDSAAINPRGISNHPPPLKFADGPPWFEDEDLVSPVVIAREHRKHKSSLGLPSGRTLSKDAKMSSITENMKDGEYGNGIEIPDDIGEPGGTYHTVTGEYYEDGEEGEEEFEGEEDEEYEGDESRYSRDYHFSIADPDEEMHGKAVALFDFRRENDNELELVEGQVIWVSYRHGQGWLVAEDPRTGESGLVPEEYVRLFKETPFENSPDESQPQEAAAAAAAEPASAKPKDSPTHTQAIQSHFSTSSKDLERYPTEQLLDSSYRLGSPPPTSRLSNNDRKDSTRSNDSMDIDLISPMTVVPNNASTIDRELFAIQQRKLESGKVLNGKDKSEQEEYQILHHKSPSMSGKASPAVVARDRDGDAAMNLTGTPPTPTSKLPGVATNATGEDNRGRPVEAR
ncbi:HOG (high osmolarity glycerol) pathway protein [Orbilia javanica]|uniref:HOG (High osmolarity glycerol) pathway protein n=1 Tax=Orbilia javanica TaxID=47235 RepID=A0AAN8MQN0_9PEZI